jgi:hypothetical protein
VNVLKGLKIVCYKLVMFKIVILLETSDIAKLRKILKLYLLHKVLTYFNFVVSKLLIIIQLHYQILKENQMQFVYFILHITDAVEIQLLMQKILWVWCCDQYQ